MQYIPTCVTFFFLYIIKMKLTHCFNFRDYILYLNYNFGDSKKNNGQFVKFKNELRKENGS